MKNIWHFTKTLKINLSSYYHYTNNALSARYVFKITWFTKIFSITKLDRSFLSVYFYQSVLRIWLCANAFSSTESWRTAAEVCSSLCCKCHHVNKRRPWQQSKEPSIISSRVYVIINEADNSIADLSSILRVISLTIPPIDGDIL